MEEWMEAGDFVYPEGKGEVTGGLRAAAERPLGTGVPIRIPASGQI